MAAAFFIADSGLRIDEFSASEIGGRGLLIFDF